MKKQQRSTLHDVAELSGVSYQTVSRVINNHPSVSPETRARVERAIARLGYRPNKVARSLVARQSNTLAILTFGMNQYGPAQMVLNIERAGKELGYDLIFSNVHTPSNEEIKRALDSLSERQVDGVLAISPVPGITYDEMTQLAGNVPIVQIDVQLGLAVPSVVVNQSYGSQIVTEYLITLGHRQIAEISGPLHWLDGRARHEQWLTTVESAGLTPGPSVEGDWTSNSGFHAVHRLLSTGATFTALVVGNDQMALGAIYALHEYNLRVPDDISVVGFDDIPESAFFIPPLTTVRQDFSQLGDVGVRYLLERMQHPEAPPRQHVIYPRLVIRHSATAPRQP